MLVKKRGFYIFLKIILQFQERKKSIFSAEENCDCGDLL